jgi:hypothetical protein
MLKLEQRARADGIALDEVHVRAIRVSIDEAKPGKGASYRSSNPTGREPFIWTMRNIYELIDFP